MKERRAYVVLVAISVFLSLVTFMASVREIDSNNHKFCQLITGAVKVPVKKPLNPEVDHVQEHVYETYEHALKLGHDLGCF
jgi:hypothetical protein